MQEVRIPAANLLPKTDGLKSPLMCLNQARYGISWGAVGAAMACYDCALQYSLLRKQFRDQPIASHQLVQEKLAWMINEITKAQLLVLQVGRLKDTGKVQHQHISMAKRNNVWMALECARPVSYTHLDVYKRQAVQRRNRPWRRRSLPSRCRSGPGSGTSAET